MKKWLIYGATGETGMRIVKQAVKRGHQPALAGRSQKKLKILATQYGLHWEVVNLADNNGLQALLSDYDLIVNVANPFDTTRPPLVNAALTTKTHYLDLANDIDSIKDALSYQQAASHARVCIMTGVGFGTVASGCLMNYLFQQMPAATNAEITLNLNTSILSPGALVSSFKEFSKLGMVIKQGHLYQLTPDERIKPQINAHHGTLIAAPMGDLQAAYEATAIPNISFYLVLDIPYTLARIINRFLDTSAKINLQVVATCIKPLVPLINALKRVRNKNRNIKQSKINIRLEQADGHSLSAALVTGEGYDFTAQVAVLAVENVLNSHLVGAMIPAQAFAADFVLQADGVEGFITNV